MCKRQFVEQLVDNFYFFYFFYIFFFNRYTYVNWYQEFIPKFQIFKVPKCLLFTHECINELNDALSLFFYFSFLLDLKSNVDNLICNLYIIAITFCNWNTNDLLAISLVTGFNILKKIKCILRTLVILDISHKAVWSNSMMVLNFMSRMNYTTKILS